MEVFLLYILKSGICLAVFYVCFKALFSNDTFFRFNRRILLVGTGICMLLPLCRIKTSQPLPFSYTTSQWEMVFHEEEVNLLPAPDKEEVLTGMTGQKETSVPWVGIIGIVYFIGCCICLVTTVLSFRKMYQLSRSGRKLQQGKYTLILLPGSLSPFSWGRYIFLSEDDYRDHPDEILTHEKMHLRHNHSVDLAYMEMILLLQWLNPAVWLLKRELRDIHEYQADKGVLNQGIDATKYQLLLVKKAVGSSLYTLANSFNHSKIKKRITMMLKKKSNNWARLKLALLVPVGLAALSAFARPEVGSPPEATGEIHLSVNKSTVNQETVQQDHAVFLTYKVSGSEDLNRLVCKTLDRIRTRVAEGQFKNTLEVTINPAFEDVPASYLEKVKAVLEEKGIKCKIDKTVPNTVMDDVAKPYRKNDDAVFLIQNKKIVAALSIERFSANQNDSRLNQISKSVPLILQPENAKVSRQEVEKLKGLLAKKGWVCKINMHAFKIGDAAAPPPPPPPPAGQVVFSYRDGQPDQQFVLYDRHAKLGPNLGQRIDKIYSDNITKVTVRINKKAPKELLETVKQELKKKIDYPVRYEILQFID